MNISLLNTICPKIKLKTQSQSFPKSKPMDFDSVSFSGFSWIKPIVSSGNINTADTNECFLANEDGHSLQSYFGSITTKAREFDGKIIAAKNINQDNKFAIVDSIESFDGAIKTNAKHVKGDIIAQGDIYLIGPMDIDGQVQTSGTIYLINTKHSDNYNFAPNSSYKCISTDDFKRDHAHKFD